jgi:ribonuclease HI
MSVQFNNSENTKHSDNILRCFTDGAAKGNSQNAPAGWAFYIPKLNIRKSGSMTGTNNQAELTAVKELLTYISTELNTSPFTTQPNPELMIFSDSKYTINILTGYKFTTNKDLINSIFELGKKLREKFSMIKFKYVEAHTNNDDWVSKCNAVVDKLASDAANGIKTQIKKDSKTPFTTSKTDNKNKRKTIKK